MISCRVLGPVDLALDGKPAPRQLLWKKNLALLVYLARSPRLRRSRSHLLALLWGEKPEAAARHSLNEALRTVRHLAGDGLVRTEGDQISLAAGNVELDTDRFAAHVANAEWDAAVSMIRGDFMDGFEVPDSAGFEDWLAVERADWRRRSVDAMVQASESRLASGDVSGAVESARRARSLDPFSNAAVRLVMQAAALEGERAQALEICCRFSETLAREIGVEPEAETLRLADRIRRERTWRLPAAIRKEAAAGRRLPLVGREEELGQALEVWRRCAEEARTAVLILEGESGVGKTRLAEELLARARLEGATLAAIRAVPSDLRSPWSGLRALCQSELLEAPGLLSAPPASLAAVAEESSEWSERFADEIQGASPAPFSRAFSSILRSSATEQPIVLFVDDVEWLDRDSLQALQGVLRDLKDLPLLLVIANAAYPPREELDEIRAHLGRDTPGAMVRLRALDRATLHELAAEVLSDYEPPELDRLARRVEADSAGLPLLATEILHAIRLGLELREKPAVWPEAEKTLDQTLPGELPDTIVSAIRIGYRRLGDNAQKALAAVAVVGERVEFELLQRATGLPADALETALDELEWKRWLVVEPRGYSFVARIVAAVVEEDMLTPGQRQRILDMVPGAAERA